MKLVNKDLFEKLMALCPYSKFASGTAARRRAFYQTMAAQYSGYQSLEFFFKQFRFEQYIKDPLFRSMNKKPSKDKRPPREVFARHILFAYSNLMKAYKTINEVSVEYCPKQNKKIHKRFSAFTQKTYKTESIAEFLARGGQINRVA